MKNILAYLYIQQTNNQVDCINIDPSGGYDKIGRIWQKWNFYAEIGKSLLHFLKLKYMS